MFKSLQRKPKRDKFPTPAVPREVQALNQEYTRLCSELGKAEYNAFAWHNVGEKLKKQILDIDVEMNARAKLDQEAAKAKEVPKVEEAKV